MACLAVVRAVDFLATLRPGGNLENVRKQKKKYVWIQTSGFGYAVSTRSQLAPDSIGSVGRLRRFEYANPLSRAARTREGHDVIIRIIALKNEGREHLNILRRIATTEKSLFNNNHTLPMFTEFEFEDIIFGVFPKVGSSVAVAYGFWAKNSVGDIVEMLLQMLEALDFIHELNIAHRDAFRDNFLIQWHPESLLDMTISPARPRVFLIDFETAIAFPPELPIDECIVTGFPVGGSVSQPEMYSRPHAPEFSSGKPYSPFKLDVWQLGNSFSDFKSTVPKIDEVLMGMIHADPGHRLGAKEALDRLKAIVYSTTPESLFIEPVVLPRN
ncbi:hypothetical protein M413DRAFT_419349 [Hebeloma cylindrosporum]|uniref:Protein kinase domain-containing protein n=1 Tax=Hebeloma cylindrosporum TaxID=76867 RepID=A0A0C3C5U8_HEBCY|nr:hypothetical protein M413DRAFT_419349 [Hebeloma cylindrosporum h7]